MEAELNDLPENSRRMLASFIETTMESCGTNLVSLVLFGSAAEGRLRPSSDVNLMVVLKTFDVAQIDRTREILRTAHAAIRLNVMFILESEIECAAHARPLRRVRM